MQISTVLEHIFLKNVCFNKIINSYVFILLAYLALRQIYFIHFKMIFTHFHPPEQVFLYSVNQKTVQHSEKFKRQAW